MPTIRIDDEVWAVLQKRAQAFVDSPNDVLRRDYGLNGETRPTPTGTRPISTRSFSERIVRGAKTPEVEYRIPILKALIEAGGRGRASDIVDRVGELMRSRLNAFDHQTVKTGEIRWRNTAEWTRNTMVNRTNPPLLNPGSDHGWWEITQDGRDYLSLSTSDR